MFDGIAFLNEENHGLATLDAKSKTVTAPRENMRSKSRRPDTPALKTSSDDKSRECRLKDIETTIYGTPEQQAAYEKVRRYPNLWIDRDIFIDVPEED